MLHSLLQTLGLTTMEAECYETLLPLGDVPLAELTRAMKRHPQIVYRLVEQLSAKGLAVTETRRHRKYVRAEDPAHLERMQEEKLRKIRDALPALRALQHRPAEARVRIERGPEAVRNLRKRAFAELAEGDTYYILSASGTDFYRLMGEELETIERLRMKRKVMKKILAFESQRALLRREERWRTLSEIRYLPETYPVPTSTNIYGNVTAIQIWSADPIVILIESDEVAASYRDFFKTLWKLAKP